MRLLSKVIDLGTPAAEDMDFTPCSDDMQRAVLASAVNHGIELTPGRRILYVELRLTPVPHLENCIVTVPAVVPGV